MSSNNRIEFLKESIDSWQQSANHDKKQTLLSSIFAAIGIVPATVGTELIFSGDVVGGLVGLVMGGSFIVEGVHEGLRELRDYTDCVSIVAVRQHELSRQVE